MMRDNVTLSIIQHLHCLIIVCLVLETLSHQIWMSVPYTYVL